MIDTYKIAAKLFKKSVRSDNRNIEDMIGNEILEALEAYITSQTEVVIEELKKLERFDEEENQNDYKRSIGEDAE